MPHRVVQISDSHLFASTDGRLLGLNTEQSLAAVISCIKKEQPQIDLVLATGDISQDGSVDSYKRFQAHLEQINAPSYWLQGNHDLTTPMLNALGGRSHLSPCIISLGEWRIIMLNSSIERQVPGYFVEEELQFLRRALAETKEHPTLVALHHHPIPMGCAWLDTQVVANTADFWRVLDVFSHVKIVMWGHVHQAWQGERNGVVLMSVPSTCVQFKPHSEDFAIDDLAPGYRWLDLFDNGEFITGTSRVENLKFEVDFSIKGY